MRPIAAVRPRWAMDYMRDQQGRFQVTCPYCGWNAATQLLSTALSESNVHQRQCEGAS